MNDKVFVVFVKSNIGKCIDYIDRQTQSLYFDVFLRLKIVSKDSNRISSGATFH